MNRPGDIFVTAARPAPEFAFVAGRGDAKTSEALKLLATALACPQVAVLTDDTEAPRSIRAIIAFGDASVAAWPTLPVYKVERGQAIVVPEWAESLNLPTEVEREFVINGFACARSLANTTAATYFYASNAHLKRSREARDEMAGKWAVCLALALRKQASLSTWQRVLSHLGPPYQPSQTDLFAPETLDRMIRRELTKLAIPEATEFFRSPVPGSFAKVRAVFHGSAHLLALWAWIHGTSNRATCMAFLEFMRPHMNTAARLSALGCAYALASEDDKADAIVRALLSDEWSGSENCLIRAKPGSNSLAIQPEVAALLIWALCRENAEPSVVRQVQRFELSWTAVTEPQAAATDIVSAGLFDRDKRVISSSLLENWLLLQQLPEGGEAQYYLADAAYSDPCVRIEMAWSEILKDIAFTAGCPYLKIKPWPAGYDFALSLRYDVDRECSAAQVENIVRIQKERLGSACGSWYFFAEAAFNSGVRDLLLGRSQEEAVHCCRPADGRSGLGATAHSGSNSEYWRGKSTVAGLLAAGAAYGEAMLSRWGVARPGWLGTARSNLWLTPLHFPLEGSTVDSTTEFFDQRLDAFRSQILSGGHVIIGSHPDCNQDILEDVLKREDLSRVWAVPVDVAVERCKSVLDYGAICLVEPEASLDTRSFRSKKAVANLALEIRLPAETETRTITVQLDADIPQTVRLKAAGSES
jgi:hypothetical protein